MSKRFRFSLLSLLVGVVLAGGVGWLNLRPVGIYFSTTGPSSLEPVEVLIGNQYGWPFFAYRTEMAWALSPPPPPSPICWHAVILDIAIGLAIVFGGAGVCEYVVRRRGKTET